MNYNNKYNYVIWLPGWFPSRISTLNGDFILRHAEAVSIYIPIIILNIVKDPNISKKEKHITNYHNLTIINIYYPLYSKYIWVERIISTILYLFYTLNEITNIIKEKGKPQILHVHIFQKSFFSGWFSSLIWKVPFVLSEHNSKFLKESESSYHTRSKIFRSIIKFLLNKPASIYTVSKSLANAMNEIIKRGDIKIIPNVVDLEIFNINTSTNPLEPFRLLHISTLTENKNCSQIIQAWEYVNKEFPNEYTLTIIGPKILHPKHDQLICKDEMTQAELAKEIQIADAIILYSGYETFGCVTIEALACGKPVILSDIPISHEIIENGIHGLVVQSNDPILLANKIIELKKRYSDFDKNKLVKYIEEKFSYRVVGKIFTDQYNEVSTL